MNKFRTLAISAIFLLIGLSSNAYAEIFTYLSNTNIPGLQGQMAGEDLLWNTADDFNTIGPFTGFNPNGHASGFLNFTDPNNISNTIDSFGSIGGSFETSGTTVTSYDVFGDISALGVPIVATPLTEVLTANTNSTFTIGPNNIASSVFNLTASSILGTVSFALTSDYAYFNNGDDFNAIFAGNQPLLDQIAFLTLFLPTNWETFFIGIESYSFNDIPLFGNQGAVFYTTASNVPEPSAIVLLGMGIVLLGMTRRKRS